MKAISLSEIGNYRKTNQDRVIILKNEDVYLAILCDGMGGHLGGDIASTLTIQAFTETFANSKLELENDRSIFLWFKKSIKKTILLMKKEVENDEKKNDMGTTLVLALVFTKEQKVIFFNIGDSRAYVYQDTLQQITVDQNQMNYLIKYENFSENEAKQVPYAHALISSLGPKKVLHPEWFKIDTLPKYVILTSDGVHDYVKKPYFETLLKEKIDLKAKCEKIVNSAIKSGSKDNLSIIILEIGSEE